MIEILDIETAIKGILRRKSTFPFIVDLPLSLKEKTEQWFGPGASPQMAVARILESVRLEGDAALRRWTELLDQATPENFLLTPEHLQMAYKNLPERLVEALKVSVSRIRAFHELQPIPNWETETLGGRLGQWARPISRVGFYVPGGTAPLPSSLLMSVIPAQVAGVKQLIVCTPPNPHPSILAAAYLCDVQAVYQVGGAQAIAALAFGTESIPPVDKIVGAGNLFVTLAKQQVYGLVGLDGLAGPTETMVIADSTANPAWVAADLLAQAEHDVLACAILLTPDRTLAEAVQEEVLRQMERLSRAGIISQSLAFQGGIVVTPDLETAASLADKFAAEHLCLSVADPWALAQRISNAGGLFLGDESYEVLGDYIAGPSHVMPTGGTARFASPLNVLDFVKLTSIVSFDAETSRYLSGFAAEIASAETLTGHAAAACCRIGERKDRNGIRSG